ncbi:MAG: DUF389 domain-containing protein [Alphaproteobacteria bacterium]|nr:MAG: DUF389 domain-containing protein [Alphaproteobacteria bacterium]
MTITKCIPNKSMISFKCIRQAFTSLELFGKTIHPNALIENAADNGIINSRFLFLVFTSSIASTVGLLINSPAIIIGSMLIAPLTTLGLVQGFAIVTGDLTLWFDSLLALVISTFLSFFVPYLLVKLLPEDKTQSTLELSSRENYGGREVLVALAAGLVAGYGFLYEDTIAFAGSQIVLSLVPVTAATGFFLAKGNRKSALNAFIYYLINIGAVILGVILVKLFADVIMS